MFCLQQWRHGSMRQESSQPCCLQQSGRFQETRTEDSWSIYSVEVFKLIFCLFLWRLNNLPYNGEVCMCYLLSYNSGPLVQNMYVWKQLCCKLELLDVFMKRLLLYNMARYNVFKWKMRFFFVSKKVTGDVRKNNIVSAKRTRLTVRNQTGRHILHNQRREGNIYIHQ